MKYPDALEWSHKIKQHLSSLGWSEETIDNLNLMVVPISLQDRQTFTYHIVEFRNQGPSMMERFKDAEFDVYGFTGDYNNWNEDYTYENTKYFIK
ncbi:MAG: hypothetical protein JSS76_20080 [Bacteroidetes bacterium]|nr:hypothetical protein [Bacteroidota bacterium]